MKATGKLLFSQNVQHVPSLVRPAEDAIAISIVWKQFLLYPNQYSSRGVCVCRPNEGGRVFTSMGAKLNLLHNTEQSDRSDTRSVVCNWNTTHNSYLSLFRFIYKKYSKLSSICPDSTFSYLYRLRYHPSAVVLRSFRSGEMHMMYFVTLEAQDTLLIKTHF